MLLIGRDIGTRERVLQELELPTSICPPLGLLECKDNRNPEAMI